MSKDWIENFQGQLQVGVDRVIKGADHTIHDLILHWHWSHWHPISTAPCNQDLELRVIEGNKVVTLGFPCRHTNADEWINADLGLHIDVEPVEWRVWQRSKVPHPRTQS